MDTQPNFSVKHDIDSLIELLSLSALEDIAQFLQVIAL
jgi:hypothetical protein